MKNRNLIEILGLIAGDNLYFLNDLATTNSATREMIFFTVECP